MITEITIEKGGFASPIKIAPENSGNGSWTTVLIGENGSRKSLLLRLIVESALGQKRYSEYKEFYLHQNDSLPNKIIAISGTPLDRFPRAGSQNIKSIRRSKRYQDFLYFGQRSNNGMSGVSQCERSLVSTLMSNRTKLATEELILKEIFGKLELLPSVRIQLAANPVVHSFLYNKKSRANRADFQGVIKKYVTEQVEKLLSSAANNEELLNSADIVLNLATRENSELLIDELGRLAPHKTILSFSPQRNRSRPNGLNIAEWEALLRIGIVDVSGVTFARMNYDPQAISANRRDVPGDRLSSGQWNWLSSFVGLALEVEPNTLVLVDEPENSLHPAWQIEYVSVLENICQRHKNCQAIIATHSPLIASGIAPECGNIVSLVRDTDSLQTESVELPSFYGWTATDVYEKLFSVRPRAKNFTDNASQALEYVRKGKKIPQTEILRLTALLTKDALILPSLDPMRIVLNNVCDALRKLG